MAVSGVVTALVLGVVIVLAIAFVSGNSETGLFWGIVSFTYLTAETGEEFFTSVFILVAIVAALGVAAWVVSIFIGGASSG